ncbi:hypothetical protein [Pandoraea sputorum]
MFLPIMIRSGNKPEDLPAGEYSVKCSVFTDVTERASFFCFEYVSRDKDRICAIDGLFVDAAGSVRMTDFVHLRDGRWRDSFGATADSVEALIPQEVVKYRFIREFRLPDVSHGGGHVR